MRKLINHNWKIRKESYPEKIVREWLEVSLANKFKIVSEYKPIECKRNYRFDFAFVDIKLAIEVNGGQHYENGKFTAYHINRQNYFKQFGWKILNIRAIDVIKDFKNVKKSIRLFIKNQKEYKFKKNKIRTQKELIEKKFKLISKCFFNGITLTKIAKKFNICEASLTLFIKKMKLTRKKPTPKYYDFDKRKKDLLNENVNKHGHLARLSRKWGISSTSARRFISYYFPEHNVVRGAHFR